MLRTASQMKVNAMTDGQNMKVNATTDADRRSRLAVAPIPKTYPVIRLTLGGASITLLLLSLPMIAAATDECTLQSKCKQGSTCAKGDADYGPLATYPYESPIEFLLKLSSSDGEHCDCGDSGHAGITCSHRYEICDDATGFPCFHGSKCRELQAGLGWMCDCRGNAIKYAGKHCEYRETEDCDVGVDGGGKLDRLETARSFCTNGGTCVKGNV